MQLRGRALASGREEGGRGEDDKWDHQASRAGPAGEEQGEAEAGRGCHGQADIQNPRQPVPLDQEHPFQVLVHIKSALQFWVQFGVLGLMRG